MGKALHIICLVATTLSLSFGQAPHISKIRKFTIHGFNSGATLRVSKDSFFFTSVALSCTGRGTSTQKIKGTYKQSGNTVRFNPTSVEEKDYGATTFTKMLEETSYWFVQRYEVLWLDSFAMLLAMDSLIVPKGSEKLSYPRNDYLNLISQINSTGQFSLGRSGIWTTIETSDFPKLDKSIKHKLPPKWRGYILDTPIEAKVVNWANVKPEDKLGQNASYVVKMNKGRKNGMQLGFNLYGGNSWINVFKLEDETCQGYLYCSNNDLSKCCLSDTCVYSTLKNESLPLKSR